MIYLFQRIIQNHFQWTRPSPGRLGPSGEGEYVQDNGFGHEDWNFNKNLLIDQHLYGYCYYQPNAAKREEVFNIAFATYTSGRWFVIGFYLNSIFVPTPPIAVNVLRQKMNDLKLLGNSLGPSYKRLQERDFIATLEDEAQWLKWRVRPADAIRTAQPVEIPKSTFDTKNYRIAKPTEIDKSTFDALFELAQQHPAYDDYGDDAEFPEGIEVERRHKLRERNQAVIKAAKDSFRTKYGSLYCQICKFDFKSIYGEIGNDYIEGHHVIPVSKLTGMTKTRVADIALVCSNCHRMLHRRRPWLELAELKKILKARKL